MNLFFILRTRKSEEIKTRIITITIMQRIGSLAVGGVVFSSYSL
jgi:hypothetical protein